MLIRLLAYFIIPGYTVSFSKGYNWFTTNFSVIGNIDKIIFAFISAVLLRLFLLLVTWSQYLLSPSHFRPYLVGWFMIVTVSAALLILAGIISRALEIFVTISTVIMSDRLMKRIRMNTPSKNSAYIPSYPLP